MADYAIHDTTLTGISNVIRKKDGTSALIDPADYADRINLMGMLEEKTVSGTIATFADGADDVPIKSWEITLPASLDGYSEVDVVSAGKNIADFSSNTQDGEYHATVSYQNNGASVSASGTYSRCAWVIPTIIGQTYTVSYSGVRDNEYGRVMFNDSNTASGVMAYGVLLLTSTEANYTKTFTATSDYLYLIIYNTGNTSTGTSTISNLMIEAGSTATTFEPYSGTTHTASLGRTIYGGTADVVTGEGVDENDNPFTFDPVPIDTKLGNNTIWSEQGDTEVTYRSQGTVYQYPEGEGVSF